MKGMKDKRGAEEGDGGSGKGAGVPKQELGNERRFWEGSGPGFLRGSDGMVGAGMEEFRMIPGWSVITARPIWTAWLKIFRGTVRGGAWAAF
jgi:hypothetical protein